MTLVPYLSSVRGRVKRINGGGNVTSLKGEERKILLQFSSFNSFFTPSFYVSSFLPVLIKQLISVTRILVNFSTPLTRFNSSAFFSVLLFLLFWYSEFSKAQYSNWNPLLLLLELYFDLLKSGERMNPKIHDRRGKDFPSRNSLSFLPLK